MDAYRYDASLIPSLTTDVLVADSSWNGRTQMHEALRDLAANVVESDSVGDVVRLVGQHPFSVIVVGWELIAPQCDRFFAQIVQGDRERDLPVLVVVPRADLTAAFDALPKNRIWDVVLWEDHRVALPVKVGFYAGVFSGQARLRSANQVNAHFLSLVSHELRTPLNSILVLAQLLSENNERTLTEKQLKFAKTIYSAGTELLHLVNDILDLTKIESGTMEFVVDDVVLADFVEDLRRKMAPVAHDKGIHFAVEVDPDVPQTARFDRVRVGQVVGNLLSNACKFTFAGEVRLHVACSAVSSDRGTVPAIAFVVSDTGVGIPADKREWIFEPFRQLEGGARRRNKGIGLGLAICRKLARAMFGDITVDSTVGRGSEFRFVLPLRIPESDGPDAAVSPGTPSGAPGRRRVEVPVPAPSTTIPPEAAALRGKKVFVAEDDIINVYVLLALLEKAEMHVEVAESGEALLALFASQGAPDVVLMDVMMPQMDGFEATRRLRADPRWNRVPVVAVTAHAMESDRSRCMAAGMDGYVTKPIVPAVLFSEMLRCVQSRAQ